MIKIYLTDLAAYNSGYLIGEWIELPLEEAELNEKLQNILKKGGEICNEIHEEYFITDFESDILDIDEYSNIYDLNNQAQKLSELNDYELKIARFLLNECLVNSVEEAIENIENVTLYENQTMQELAYELVEELYDINNLPSLIGSHIDYQGIARDLEIEGRYYEIEGDIYEYM